MHQGYFNKRMNRPILKIVIVQNIFIAARNLINSAPKQQRRTLPFLLYLSFFYDWEEGC